MADNDLKAANILKKIGYVHSKKFYESVLINYAKALELYRKISRKIGIKALREIIGLKLIKIVRSITIFHVKMSRCNFIHCMKRIQNYRSSVLCSLFYLLIVSKILN